ncbi:DUF2971 domain-containing protein [Gillisia sp. Hel_I_29]|uniref:DUF2971 domain-containing protein n=1 Tax=Gillisia sp. Hel_I_29 TaxID=1249975 RepID=UPI00068C46F1|nr:DUF2971 domain-containing protein [Gillisia sp. Hel_I_29]
MFVYKYRSGEKYDFDSLKHNQFWASTSKELNDPCEGIVNSKYIKFGLNLLGKLFGIDSVEERKFIEQNAVDVLSFNLEKGIYSLSKTPLDELLWAHYSNSHKGFCIQYDLDKLLQTDGILISDSVRYSDDPPEIPYTDILPKNSDSHMKKSGFFKSKRWEYEEEYRIITDKFGLNTYSQDAIKGIYFGLKMSTNHINQILEIFKGKKIDFYKIALEQNSYKLKSVKLENLKMFSTPN